MLTVGSCCLSEAAVVVRLWCGCGAAERGFNPLAQVLVSEKLAWSLEGDIRCWHGAFSIRYTNIVISV